MQRVVGDIGQWLSLIATAVGLYLMIHNHRSYGDIFITAGALLLTTATKIKYYGDRIIERHRNFPRVPRTSRSSYKWLLYRR